MAEPDRPQMITERMRFAGWITKATHTHTGYVILTALPRQQCLKKRMRLIVT
jgi:hypothetical protein